eukprot:10629218-Ditylum_brightwellii.AAC.1
MAKSSSNVTKSDPQGIITSNVIACMSPSDTVKEYLSNSGGNGGGNQGNSDEIDLECIDTDVGSINQE